MKIRDRVKELRRVKAGDLRPHPKNWRTHPQAQRDALCGVLAEIGYAAALLARELPDGSLQLIDGHLRAETTPDTEVPVLVVDLDDCETAKLLALHDSVTGMAEADHDVLADLLSDVTTESDAVQAILDQMLVGPEIPPELEDDVAPLPQIDVPDSFQVVVECGDEAQQQAIYQRMTAEGFRCKLLTL